MIKIYVSRLVVPESPRWLLSTGRHVRAEQVIKNIAAKNGNKEFSQNFKIEQYLSNVNEEINTTQDPSRKSYGLKDLFNRKIVVFTLVQMVTWPAVSLGYFGNGENIKHLNLIFPKDCLTDPPRWRVTSSRTTSSCPS